MALGNGGFERSGTFPNQGRENHFLTREGRFSLIRGWFPKPFPKGFPEAVLLFVLFQGFPHPGGSSRGLLSKFRIKNRGNRFDTTGLFPRVGKPKVFGGFPVVRLKPQGAWVPSAVGKLSSEEGGKKGPKPLVKPGIYSQAFGISNQGLDQETGTPALTPLLGFLH